MKRAIRDHTLSIVLGGLLIVMMVVSWFTGTAAYTPESGPYWKFWLAELVFSLNGNLTLMLIFTILTKHFVEKGSTQSKE